MDSFWEKKKNETRSALSFFDEFFKNLIILQNQNEERKRSLLRVFSFIQDPLGFWSAISEAHFKKRREKSEPPLNSRYYGRFIVRVIQMQIIVLQHRSTARLISSSHDGIVKSHSGRAISPPLPPPREIPKVAVTISLSNF